MFKKLFQFIFKLNKKRTLIVVGVLFFILNINRLELFDPLSGVSFSKEIYDRHSQLLRLSLSNDDQYRLHRKLSEINSEFQKAVLLNEDRYFYYHYGVNPISILRALFTLNQSRPVGASTITMQMVRLRDKIYTKSIFGKFQQILAATWAELLYSKKQIFEAYLNLTPYGANIEGIAAACLIYFNKQPDKLSLAESLLLAVIPQNPVKRNLQKENHRLVIEARDRLYLEYKKKYTSQNNLNIEIKIPVLNQKISELPFLAPHFVNYVLDKTTEKKVTTTLDINVQSLIEKKLNTYIQSKNNIGIHNGAVLLVGLEQNEIKSWVGSNNFFDSEIEGQIDAITTKRSPGSALKPFLYGLAFEQGLIHPQSVLFDTPSSFGTYDPENFDHTYKGPLSAEEALIQSRNVPAIYLASRLKQKSLYQLLQVTGARLTQPENYYGLAIALGAAEVTPLHLASLYSALAHQGIWKEFSFKRHLNMKLDSNSENHFAKIFSPESSYMVLDILKKNLRSESLLLDEIGKQKISVAWKTGTSYGYRDAWVAGLVGDHLLLVWLGNFDNSSNPALVGREIAAPLFFQLVDLLVGKKIVKPSSWEDLLGLKLKSTEVCSLTGGFSKGVCPHTKKTWFNPGVSPIDECLVHREFLISNKTAKRICRLESPQQNIANYHKEVFEFWPSDVIQLFQKFGIPYKKAPLFEADCDQSAIGQVAPPEIVSPKLDLKYAVRFDEKNGYEKIPLKAKVDQDVKKVFWFANQKPLGESSPLDAMMVELQPGNYEIVVVDDHGQISDRSLQVQLVQ